MPSVPPLSDVELRQFVHLAREGDSEAFAKIYDHFFPAVYRYASFRLPAEAAEDTVADVFVRAWEKLHTYKIHHDVPFAAWLFRIARNAVIDVYRTQRGFEEVPETLPDENRLNQADYLLRTNEITTIVRHALNRMPQRYRDILLLSYISDLPHSAIADILNLSEGAVRILKLRALRKLETLLPPDLSPPT